MIVVLIVVSINPNFGKEVKEVDSFSLSINIVKEIGIVDSFVDIDIQDDKVIIDYFNSKLKFKFSFSILSSQVFEIFNFFSIIFFIIKINIFILIYFR